MVTFESAGEKHEARDAFYDAKANRHQINRYYSRPPRSRNSIESKLPFLLSVPTGSNVDYSVRGHYCTTWPKPESCKRDANSQFWGAPCFGERILARPQTGN